MKVVGPAKRGDLRCAALICEFCAAYDGMLRGPGKYPGVEAGFWALPPKRKLDFFCLKKKKCRQSRAGLRRPSKSGGGSGGVHSGLSVSARGVELGYKLDGHTNTTTHAHTPNGGDERPGKQIERPSRSFLAVVVTLGGRGWALKQFRRDGGSRGRRRGGNKPVSSSRKAKRDRGKRGQGRRQRGNKWPGKKRRGQEKAGYDCCHISEGKAKRH